jgi:hypothetical protein
MSVDRSRGSSASRIRVLFRVLALVLGGGLVLGANCGSPFVQITSPANGAFSTAGSVVVTGKVLNFGNALIDATVNGVSVLPLAGDGTFSISVALDPGAIANPIVLEATRTNGKPLRHRVTVIAGDSVPDGALSTMGVALRLNDTGLDEAEPLIASLVDLDPATLLSVGTLVLNDYCAIPGPFGTCLGRMDVTVSTPAPSITGFGIAVDSLADDLVAGDITIGGLEANFFLNGSGLAPDCGLEITASSTMIAGDYGLQADALDPRFVDVFQNGAVDVNFTGFGQEFTSGLCDFPLIGSIIQLIVGNLEGTVEQGFEGFLNDVDPNGNTPVAGAIETALADIEISGPIGQAIGVNLDTPLFDVYEDSAGITLDADASITASLPDPLAPDLLASYHVDEAFPPFGALSPGGLPYDLAIAISTSAFNQLLKAEIESGLLRTSLTEFDLGTGPIPLTAGFLALIVPEFGLIDPATPLRLHIAPKLAPIMTGNPGPFGEQNELLVTHLDVRIVVDQPNGPLLLQFAVDVPVGLNVSFDDLTDHLSFELGTMINPVTIEVTILRNELSSAEPLLTTLVQQLGSLLFPELASSLETFPLPDFLGLDLQFVEVAKSGEFNSLFFDLEPAP